MHRPLLELVAVFGLGAGACATSPDVVATGKTVEAGRDGRFITDNHLCVAGPYEGTFNYSSLPDAQPTYPVSGTIQFKLRESGSGEFSIVESGAKLSGKPDQGDRMSADIDPHVDGGAGGCYEGHFRVGLVNGEYYLNDASAPVEFTGIVEGDYKADPKRAGSGEFTGQWKAFFRNTTFQISQGNWQALWHGN